MDLAQGHVDALTALPKDDIFKSQDKGTGFGASGGKFKAYNLGKGKGMSVLQMVDAMHKASGFEYKVEVVGRRYVHILICHATLIPQRFAGSGSETPLRAYSTGDVPELVANPELAEKELNFKAQRNLEEMCRDQWNWQSYVVAVAPCLFRGLTSGNRFALQQKPQGLRGFGLNQRAFKETYGLLFSPLSLYVAFVMFALLAPTASLRSIFACARFAQAEIYPFLQTQKTYS